MELRHLIPFTAPVALVPGCGAQAPTVPPSEDVVCMESRILFTTEDIDAFVDEGCDVLEGDLMVLPTEPAVFPTLREVTGTLSLAGEVALPALEVVGGLQANGVIGLDLPVLTTSGVLDASSATDLAFPALVEAETIVVRAPSVALPSLAVAGTLTLEGVVGLEAPSLRSVVTIRADQSDLGLPGLVEAGALTARSASLPQLQVLGSFVGGPLHAAVLGEAGSVDVRVLDASDLATSLPILREIGDLVVRPGLPSDVVLPGLEEVHGTLTAHEAEVVRVPVLTYAGGLDVSGTAVRAPLLEMAGSVRADLAGVAHLPVLVSVDTLAITASAVELDSLETAQQVFFSLGTGSANLPALTGEVRLSVQGGTGVLVGPGAHATLLWVDQVQGDVDVPLAPVMELLSIGYMDVDTLDLAGLEGAGSVELRSLPNLTSVQLPDLVTIGEIAISDAPSLTTLGIPALATITGCATVGGTALGPGVLASLQDAAEAGGGGFTTQGVCP
ncbi:MAG: hypothetical protein H6734_04210 [Alphaproteobacteria bacterium]|nr:hypothetical protein [Alphaproteobacteria bacterium]